MNVLCLIIACSLGANDSLVEGSVGGGTTVGAGDAIVRPSAGMFAAPQPLDVPSAELSDGEISAELQPVAAAVTVEGMASCGCAYCAGGNHRGWPGNPYTECSNCRRDGTMWPYDYRRVFDYPWHGPNYAWGSPFVPHTWWPEVEAMYGSAYPYAHNPQAATNPGDSVAAPDHVTPMPAYHGLTPIASPPFPTPMQRKIIRID